MVNPHVATVQQRLDDTIVVHVQTDSFEPDQEVEVSVYLTQGETYAAFNDKQRIPPPNLDNPKQPAVLQVELPATNLNANEKVTVVTRVAEVWPTVLQQNSKLLEEYKKIMERYKKAGKDMGQALKAVWTYEESEGKGAGGPESPPPSS
jgi:hypothetical protein